MRTPELNPNAAKVRGLLDQALSTLARRDAYLVKNNLSERAVTHKLGEYLQALFPEWDVDCEYNRDGPDTKCVSIPNAGADLEDSPVYPDIIVHKRGDWRGHDVRPHLLVVEARKAGWHYGKVERDKWKIWAYLGELRYRFGALIEYSFVEGEVRFSTEFVTRDDQESQG